MSSEHLAAAAAAGRLIVADAVWHDGCCGWIGAAAGHVGTYRALGPTLYKGTAGVGLFLAQLAAITGDADAHRTALGALRHALRVAPRLPPAQRGGFHVGITGVAHAAVEAAVLLDAPELHASAGGLPWPAKSGSPDVLTGSAGAVAGLLALAGPLESPALIERALAIGDALLDEATPGRRGGWSWPTPERGSRRHLYGFAYGANGIAWALLELYAATGEDRFLAGAERGFAYERSWLDERTGRWARERLHGSPLDGSGSWCHGDAGIALARLRAAEVLGSAAHLGDAERALASSRGWLAETLRDGIQDLSLCHGAAGVAEASGRESAVAAFALERPPGDWPGGAGHGTTPGLFRGTSGIGWWLLRVHDPTLRSPLALPTVDSTSV